MLVLNGSFNAEQRQMLGDARGASAAFAVIGLLTEGDQRNLIRLSNSWPSIVNGACGLAVGLPDDQHISTEGGKITRHKLIANLLTLVS